MLGSGGVGKTAITLQFVRSEFSETYVPTIEDEFQKNISIDGETIICEIIDTAGQEDFKELRGRYIQDCEGFACVYAVDDESSLNFISELYDDIVRTKKTQKPPIVILGNKCDLPAPHAVPLEKAKAKSASAWNNAEVLETSAKVNKNISEAFESICRLVLNKEPAKKAHKDEPKKKESGGGDGCCEIQ